MNTSSGVPESAETVVRSQGCPRKRMRMSAMISSPVNRGWGRPGSGWPLCASSIRAIAERRRRAAACVTGQPAPTG